MRIEPPPSAPSDTGQRPAATATAGPLELPPLFAGRVVRVARRAIVRVAAVRVDADLVHVGLADQQRAGGAQAGDGRRILGCGLPAQKSGADCGRIGGLIHFVFDRHRHAVEDAQRAAGANAGRGRARLGQHVVGIVGDEGAQGRVGRVARLDRGQHPGGDLLRGCRAGPIGLRVIAHGLEENAGDVGRQRRLQFGRGHGAGRRRSRPGQGQESGRLVQPQGAEPRKAALFQQAGHQERPRDRVGERAGEGAQACAGQLR